MWTIAEFSKIEGDPLRKSILDYFLMEVVFTQLMPWETIGQLSTGIIRYQDLPSMGFRRINAGYDSTDIGHLEHKMEAISLFGRDIDTDEAIARSKNSIADARALMQQMTLKGMVYTLNDKFINGLTNLANPLEFNGLKKRIDDNVADGFTGQKIDAACAGKGILNDSAASQAFLDKLNQAMFAVAGHQPQLLLMNSDLYLAVFSLLRREKLLDTTRDMFDRQIDVYRGARMVDMGTKADQLTKIITSTETSTGAEGSSEHTSLYCVRFGVGDMMWGLQQFPMEVKDLGELQEKPTYRTRITWNIGMADANPYASSRLYGIIPDASS